MSREKTHKTQKDEKLVSENNGKKLQIKINLY